ncbi:MAG: patatin [Gammaproteobacteria bacterium]|nr:patatin [Gammaproteobacteria bacterium]MDH5729782.1 patatin [Gammaproteobacteria bacterium]
MNSKNRENKFLIQVVFFIAIVTIASGLSQLIMPEMVLTIIGGEVTPGGAHSFAIIGMFMVFFGLLAIHALSTETQEPVAIFWCAIQKLGATIAVAMGVSKGLFSALALVVAAFDLFSFVVMMVFWVSIRKNEALAY